MTTSRKPHTVKAVQTDTLLNKHPKLVQSDNQKVVSHVQRSDGDWFLNTLMLERYDTPFQFRRKKAYQNLTGARVNLSYYPETKELHGLEFETMKVVRVRRS